jgi:hypothetical protein
MSKTGRLLIDGKAIQETRVAGGLVTTETMVTREKLAQGLML